MGEGKIKILGSREKLRRTIQRGVEIGKGRGDLPLGDRVRPVFCRLSSRHRDWYPVPKESVGILESLDESDSQVKHSSIDIRYSSRPAYFLDNFHIADRPRNLLFSLSIEGKKNRSKMACEEISSHS